MSKKKKKISVLRAERRNERRRLRNLMWKTRFKYLLRKFKKVESLEEKREWARKLQSTLDKIGQRRIFHPNKVARLKSKIMKELAKISQNG
jgi:ribosomal protein S20